MNIADYYKSLYTIRFFEESLLNLFSRGHLNGTTHTCIGQEANSVGLCTNLDSTKDTVFSNHRGHGHYISFTGDIKGLLFEIMGLEKGVCKGLGGSQHLQNGNFFTNGIQGGIVPITVGISLAEKFKNSNGIAVVFLGDGTLGEGVVYESFNMASLWNAPVLFVIENNYYAQSTPSYLQIAGEISARPMAFGIETVELNTTDVFDIEKNSKSVIDKIRNDKKPRCLILNTYRFSPHSKGDDFRDKMEIEEKKKFDPITLLENRLDKNTIDYVKNSVKKEINSIINQGLEN